jgi:hypothetical protein
LFVEVIGQCRGKKKSGLMLLSEGAMWTLWKSRNNAFFNNKILVSLATVIHKTLMMLKTWRPLLKPEAKKKKKNKADG